MALMIMHGVLEQCIMQRMEKPENGWLRQIPNVVGIGGGAPIKVGNETIGGVGVSGAPAGENDEARANTGIARVADALK